MLHLTANQKNMFLNSAIYLIEQLPVIDEDTLYDLIVGDDSFVEKCETTGNIHLPYPPEITDYAAEVIGFEIWNVIDDAYAIVLDTHVS